MAKEKQLTRLIQEESGSLTLADGTLISGEKRVGKQITCTIEVRSRQTRDRKIENMANWYGLGWEAGTIGPEKVEGIGGNAYLCSIPQYIGSRDDVNPWTDEITAIPKINFTLQFYQIPNKYLQENN